MYSVALYKYGRNPFSQITTVNMKLVFKRNDKGCVVETAVVDQDSAGLVKAKKYDWKDSNLSLFGSDVERNVKKSSAETEKAWNVVRSATTPAIFVWKIEQFKVVSVPKEEYGKFYNGDSYIILKITKEDDKPELLYDIHFWIGKQSSQDEYGTAAYKTVELDTLLDDRGVQHREVQGFESDLFKSYFPIITIMKGGSKSGFHHVSPDKYEPRLLHFRCTDRKHVELVEVKFSKQALSSEDVYILDNGLEVFQWNGRLSNKNEKYQAAQFLQHLQSDRNGRCKAEVLEEEDVPSSHKIFKLLPDTPCHKKTTRDFEITKSLYRLSDETSRISFSLVSRGHLSKSMINENDIFMIDNSKRMFVYIGTRASQIEKKNAMSYAHEYLKSTDHPLIGITCFQSGQESEDFKEQFD